MSYTKTIWENDVTPLSASNLNKIEDQIEQNTEALSVDYIVEQGVSGNWVYRKWNSGIAECWGIIKTGTYTNTNTWGSGKYMNLGSVSFPSSFFIAKPTIITFVEKPGGSGMPFFSLLNVAANTFDGYIFDPNTSSTGYSYSLHAHALGRWKA